MRCSSLQSSNHAFKARLRAAPCRIATRTSSSTRTSMSGRCAPSGTAPTLANEHTVPLSMRRGCLPGSAPRLAPRRTRRLEVRAGGTEDDAEDQSSATSAPPRASRCTSGRELHGTRQRTSARLSPTPRFTSTTAPNDLTLQRACAGRHPPLQLPNGWRCAASRAGHQRNDRGTWRRADEGGAAPARRPPTFLSSTTTATSAPAHC